LECLLANVDPKVYKFIARKIGVDSSKVNRKNTQTPAEWADAVTKFETALAKPNCAGKQENTQGWCVIGITKAECTASVSGTERSLTWIDDPASSAASVGFCKKAQNYYQQASPPNVNEFNGDKEALEGCQRIFTAMQGHCVGNIETQQQGCTNAGGTWVDYSSKTVNYHRLVGQTVWAMDSTTGDYEPNWIDGDETKCEMEKTCNWDPDARYTGGNETKCLSASDLTLNSLPVRLNSASLEENGSKMACLRCWGSRCEDFWPSSAAICAVGPNGGSAENCAGTGGGPESEAAVTPGGNFQGMGSHVKCRRDNKDTEAACLDGAICPVPARHSDQNDDDVWIRNCEETACFETSLDMSSCTSSGNIHRSWRPTWKRGAGLCQLLWNNGNMREKSACEGAGGMYWEGRTFMPAFFATSATCTGYCDDGSWPPKEECPANAFKCDASCPQCIAGGNSPVACVDDTKVDEAACAAVAASGYEWHWDAQVCYKKDFAGDATACSALGSSAHSFHTCGGRTEANCQAYCWAKDHTDESACNGAQGHGWMWEQQRCAIHDVSEEYASACTSYGNSSSCYLERGCQWDGSACSGTPKACDQQSGTTEWIPGAANVGKGSTITKALLMCRFDNWARCSTQNTCTSAGECEDWYMDGGACVVPHIGDDNGHTTMLPAVKLE
jgi:hypothetical protein